jgi:DNA (cytosine-5)-methyltransferase 1
MVRKHWRKKLKFLDVCSGIGGFRLGLEDLGFSCAGSIEVNETSVLTYNENYKTSHKAESIFDVNHSNINDHDLLCAGFPCQAFSIAGKQNGFLDPRGTIIFEIIKILKHKQPKFALLENVKNLKTHDKGRTLKEIHRLLYDIGYISSYKILNSKNFGVPQNRERIFIMAVRKDCYRMDFQFPYKKGLEKKIKDILCEKDFSIPISEKWQQYIDYYTGKKTSDELNFILPKTRKSIERISPGTDLNDCILTMRSSGIRACSVGDVLPTLAVSISGGGAMIPVYTKEKRHLSLLELKRIMGFPDDFVFPVSRTNAIKQLANAVCPPVITAIGYELLNYNDLL